MNNIGICFKCKEEKIVRDHHIKGYLGDNKDTVVPYCYSCDIKAHNEARKNGKCKLLPKESTRLSVNSCNRRTTRVMDITMLGSAEKAPGKNVCLYEHVKYNLNTGHVSFSIGFRGNHGYKLKEIF